MMAKGAGEVLKSSFVLSGWKFPRPIVTDGDDRFLFDLEVIFTSPALLPIE